MRFKFTIAILLILSAAMLVPALAASDCGDCSAVGRSAAEIAAYPHPNVRQLAVDADLLHDRRYQEIAGTITTYDAPDGNPLRTLDEGFNFITLWQEIDGWVEINPGEWTPAAQLSEANGIVSNFSGVLLPEEGLPYPMAWALVNLKPSLAPGGDPHDAYPMVWRYSRVNIYDAVQVEGFEWYQIGVNQWVHQYHVAKVLPVERPESVDTRHWVSIDLYEQVVIAYEGNRPVFATLASTGLPRWETVEGTFHIYYRNPRHDMSGGLPGDDFYYLEEVPWTMFFDEGRALHGAYWHNGFGYRRSHGCVNLSITDAYWLYHWVADAMGKHQSADIEVGPAVFVYSSGVYV